MKSLALLSFALICLPVEAAFACQSTVAEVEAFDEALRSADVIVIGVWAPDPECAQSEQKCMGRIVVARTERGVPSPEYSVPYRAGLHETLCDSQYYGLPEGSYGRFYLDRDGVARDHRAEGRAGSYDFLHFESLETEA
jgi:hypothetical protein